MELDAAIITNLDKLVEEWLQNATPGHEMELEAVFGEDGVVDATTFVAVAQRLQAKGYSPVQQDDRLSILVPEGLRFSIEGAGVVPILQNYCRDDVIQGKPFTVLRKSSHSPTNKIQVQDYGFYLKNRIEELVDPVSDPDVMTLLDNWAQVDKGFRLIKRWAFEGKGMKIDMSMVRSTPSMNGAFQWQKKFKERDIFKQPIRYEIEVELKRCDDTKDKEGARRCLVQGIGEILRAIQKNTFLIKQPETDAVLRDYAALNKTGSFRGVQPITMEVKHMVADLSDKSVANIRNNYNVTDKADGLRVLAYCNSQGELFLLDGGMVVYKTGLRNKACTDSILDGEWVTRTADNKAISYVLLFDIYTFKEETVSGLPFYVVGSKETRFTKLNAWMDAWNGDSDGRTESVAHGMTPRNTFQVKLKHFEFANPENPNSIFIKCAAVLNTKQIYHTDGLILTPNLLPLPKKSGTTFWEQFKWKPAEENTIDFLVQIEKKRGSMLDLVETGPHPDTGESVRYKTLRLYVKSDKESTILDDPRTTILEMLPLRKEREVSDRSKRRVYKPTYFIPTHYSDVMANTCYLPVHVMPDTGNEFVETETKEALQENTIVEMRYDRSRSPGWQWIPIRIRHDKTERLAKGLSERTMNSDINANGVWNSIHNPVTFSMITTGAEQPTLDELRAVSREKRYYNRAAPKEDMALIRGLRDFHNHYIKEQLLYRTVLSSGPKTILDLACGQGGDLDFWYKNKAAFVLGVDIDLNNIRNKQQGIYRRYLNYLTEKPTGSVPPMVFAQADSAKPLQKGEAAFQADDKNILRSLFAKERPDGPIPPLLAKELGGRLKDGADVAVCMFALHYFLKDLDTFNGFLANLRDCVKVGGYFIGCCTDGKQVFNRLKELKQNDVAVGKEGETLIWSITKKYDAHELRADDSSLGLPIDVNFMSIGTEQTEYLVSFEYLRKRLEEIGFALLTPAELTAVGLTQSTNLFGESYKMVPKGVKYPMSAVVKEFSFLSRWFIFKRQGETGKEEEEEEVVVTAAAAATAIAEEEEKEEAVVKAVSTVTSLPAPDAIVEIADIFQFGPEVRVSDPFKIGDNRTPNIIAPFWPWTIEEDGTAYPSLEHYWAAMKLTHATNKPEVGAELAPRLLGSKGKIHQDILGELATKGIAPGSMLDARQRLTLIASHLREVQEIRKAMASVGTVNKIIIDEAKWNSIKDEYYRKGLTDRWTRDTLFHTIVDKARVAKKYLLYVQTKKTGDPMGELSGIHLENGRIAGGNKIGRLLMEIAGFSLA
jgi:SAM-dependent methyltransferase